MTFWGYLESKLWETDRQTDRYGICIKRNIPRYPNYLSSRAWASEFLLTNPNEFAFSKSEFHVLVDWPVCSAIVRPVSVSCIVPAGLLPSSCPHMFDPGSSQQPGLFPLNLRSHRSSLLRTPLGLPSVLRLKSNGFIQACSGTERPGTHSPETQQNSVGTGGGWRLQSKQGVFFLDIEGIWSWIHLC